MSADKTGYEPVEWNRRVAEPNIFVSNVIDIPYKHFKFQDKKHGEVAFIQEGECTGWIFTRHADRHWVSLRMANADDLQKIERTMAVMN